MGGKKTTTINTLDYRVEKLNTQQNRIYTNQLRLINSRVCKKCNDKFWEDLDLLLRDYYYRKDNYKLGYDREPFNLNLIKKKYLCKSCWSYWEEYIGMEDERFRLDVKKTNYEKQLIQKYKSQKVFNKYFG
tara:strand:- start:2317 stop:2709 length:393 start_codon:yes stop_codon:yes gene_type:complete